ncbi:hypothetical protein SKAU_G00160120 [Synaphobranchus kaupii]|uniref:Uncharacterized protein n=1 Tax=Synaphobranchus kaupii TaxID=118154 RepID=A0A9Q1FIT5_SYNKA|nr:hypothetical protein SKAU_G00160120 [Synaphobranchus kaupii]
MTERWRETEREREGKHNTKRSLADSLNATVPDATALPAGQSESVLQRLSALAAEMSAAAPLHRVRAPGPIQSAGEREPSGVAPKNGRPAAQGVISPCKAPFGHVNVPRPLAS